MSRFLLSMIILAFSASLSPAQTDKGLSDDQLGGDAGPIGETATAAELTAFGERLREMILREDIEGLMTVMEYGLVSPPNERLTREQVLRKLRDTESDLHRRLFKGPESLKWFLSLHHDSVVEIIGACDYTITFSTADEKTSYSCWFVLFKHQGKLRIWQFPVCNA